MTGTPILELRNITKTFPGVVANEDVSFSVGRGEIHALLGENGAGKSTLVKMIYGIQKPDSGEMTFMGEAFAPSKPSEARQKGVGMVFQHFCLFEALTVYENIALGLSAAEAKTGDLRQRIIDVSTTYGLKVDPDRLVGTLSVGERQRIEIVRCLLSEPKLLIMDEPTSVLTPQEVNVLFETLRRLASEGCSILYISHKLEEIRALCSKATVLRGGKLVGSCDPRRETAKSLAEMMIGATLNRPVRDLPEPGEIRLKVQELSMESDEQFGVDLENVTMAVRAGEILGIAGVAGNGQTELMEALIGERPCRFSRQIQLDGADIGQAGPRERRALGMCFAPEERLGHAAVPGMALWENTLLSAGRTNDLARRGLISPTNANRFALRVVDDLKVKTAGVKSAARSLSGGNLQKFIMGREIMQRPKVLIASQPTWGVDAGAAATIHRILLDLAREGAAVVIISQDLDELFTISTRISVIAGGYLFPSQPTGELTVESLGLAMGGRSKEIEAAKRADEAVAEPAHV
ncbi:ABC transporter ATP-binding protein [Chelatococcus sambhunathii]|uniref:ABC transporter ATP-binding protein n=1 Tax=Chelatococcus sambhunathii TaxID=363953 RepID=A0ABU1DDC0_9HYPH|nr:ABC transporter ATP-binding protein [Chelatococcus sambhunathii]MDR4306043.1 ABC transporter ATP-binding protein [Chelatococcus sambhunathii]